MSVYTTQKAVESYIEGWTTTDQFALERLIRRSERDIDPLITPLSREYPPTQVISIINAASGTFRLHWNGPTPQTVDEPYNVSASQLEADLQAFTDIGAGNVSVLGANPYTLLWTWQWASKFSVAGTSARPFERWSIPLVTVDTTNLSGGAEAAVDEVQGLKVNPLTDLDRNQVLALSNATCAQVEYRNAMGGSFFVRAQYRSVKGPDFTTSGKLPTIGPRVRWELSQTGLLFVGGRASASRRRSGVGKGWPTY